MIIDEQGGAHRDASPLGFATTIAVLLLASLGQIVSYVSPFTLTALMKGYGVSQGAAAVAVSTEVASLALALMIASRGISRLNLRSLAVAGTVIAIIGQVLTISSGTYGILLVARCLSGLGSGCSIAVAYAIISRSPAPPRLFTIQSAFLGFLVVLLFTCLPRLQALIGPLAQFLGVGIALLVTLPFAALLRTIPIPAQNVEVPKGQRSTIFWLFFACVTLFGMGSNALWLHFETMGELRGVTFGGLATVITISAATMMLAPLVSLFTFRRVGGFMPIVIGCVLQMAIIAFDLLIDSAALFIASALVLNFLIAVQLVYSRILAAELDSSGGMASGVGAGDFAGSFCGPLLGGIFIVHATANETFAVAISASLIAAAVIATIAARWTDARPSPLINPINRGAATGKSL